MYLLDQERPENPKLEEKLEEKSKTKAAEENDAKKQEKAVARVKQDLSQIRVEPVFVGEDVRELEQLDESCDVVEADDTVDDDDEEEDDSAVSDDEEEKQTDDVVGTEVSDHDSNTAIQNGDVQTDQAEEMTADDQIGNSSDVHQSDDVSNDVDRNSDTSDDGDQADKSIDDDVENLSDGSDGGSSDDAVNMTTEVVNLNTTDNGAASLDRSFVNYCSDVNSSRQCNDSVSPFTSPLASTSREKQAKNKRVPSSSGLFSVSPMTDSDATREFVRNYVKRSSLGWYYNYYKAIFTTLVCIEFDICSSDCVQGQPS